MPSKQRERCKPDSHYQLKDPGIPDDKLCGPFDPDYEDPFPPDAVGKVPAQCCVAQSSPCKVTSKVTNWSVTVSRGGFGGDNVRGAVTDQTGAAAVGVWVEIINQDNGDMATAKTNIGGNYDEDVNASKSDVVVVRVRKQKRGQVFATAVCKLN